MALKFEKPAPRAKKKPKPIPAFKEKKEQEEDLLLEAELPFAKKRRTKDRSEMDKVKSARCVISGATNTKTNPHKVDPCHIQTRGSGAPDAWWNMIPMKRIYHIEQGQIGWYAMAEKYYQIKSELQRRGWGFDEHKRVVRIREVA